METKEGPPVEILRLRVNNKDSVNFKTSWMGLGLKTEINPV